MKIVDEWAIPSEKKDIKVLTLDGEIAVHNYNRYVIDGKEYVPLIVYDLKNCIAINVTGNEGTFIGKDVEFVRV